MRVLVCFEGSSEPFDVPPDLTVGAMRQMIKEYFLIHLSNDKKVRRYLELSFGGAALQDTWALCDVGIRRGSVIRCLIKTEQRPVLNVFSGVTGEILPIMGSEAFLHMSVATLKTVVSMESGLPVSTFRLSTASGVQLYDCNQLKDYTIQTGTTLHLETWDGWVEFLQTCLQGHRLKVQSRLSEKKTVMRFQLQVALYIAASLGHLDLAVWLLERGVHADQPVGVHPYRQWCHQTAHRDSRKCPVHVAAESGQLLILKLFITKNPLTLACQDPVGRNSLKVAVQHSHRECVRYLSNKLYSVVSLPHMSLSMHIYLQLKRWLSLGQKRAASNQCLFTGVAFKGRVADKLLVDGFNQPKMSSQSRISGQGIKTKTWQPLPPNKNLFSVSNLVSKRTPSKPSRLQTVKPSDAKEKQKRRQQDLRRRKNGLFHEMSEGHGKSFRGKCILPPISDVSESTKSTNMLTLSLESYSHLCGRTPRENAVYYLTTASAFTEKPWLKQLKIARTLIRKHVHSMA